MEITIEHIDGKACSKCKEHKPLSAFNVRKASKDGLQPRCKHCDNLLAKQYRQDNIETTREKDRARGKEAARLRATGVLNRRYRAKHKDRGKANAALNHAIRDGKIFRWPVCAVWDCNREKPDAHHADYSRPLAVTWLCRVHHKQVHQMIEG
jgi:hypothetical protein